MGERAIYHSGEQSNEESVGFFAEFILSWGTFFDGLRMSGGKSQNERGKEIDENSEGLRFFDGLRMSGGKSQNERGEESE